MAVISDYLDWRGDIPFSVSPFNEVDNYIIAKIGGPDYTGIVPREAVSQSIGAVVDRYYGRYGKSGDYLGALASGSIGTILRRLPETERFRDVRLSGYINKVVPEMTEQFSALTLTLPDGTHYVSFRGTDDTIAGWKENFMMSLESAVPAQRDAAEYLAWAASAYPGPLIVGGHSKGGNLAVYAASQAAPEVQERITAVYNNDGPGFNDQFLASEGYRAVRDRVITLLPRFSIVGTLMKQDDRQTVVQCQKTGIAAHDGFNWETGPQGFVHCSELSRSSRAFDEAVGKILDRMDLEERKAFIEALFGLLTSTGAKTLTDINKRKLLRTLELAKGLHKDKTVQRVAVETLELIIREYATLVAEQRKEKRSKKDS